MRFVPKVVRQMLVCLFTSFVVFTEDDLKETLNWLGLASVRLRAERAQELFGLQSGMPSTWEKKKIIESFKTNLLVFQKKSLKCFCSVIKLRLKSLQINERSLKLCINSEEVIIQPIETLILGVSIIGTVRQTCRYEVRP